ncbi:MAG: hypothetical protein Q9227_004038 [Pyrenula ochraceoflavens]
MPSSITLTVSHLPTSTSFFLSALQPLHYEYRGSTDNNNTVGFGSSSTPDAPPDFWLSQEIPGVPAGAVHVAFPATSHTQVQQFFSAALKAGARVHGEPATRDTDGYYSGAVIDFDGNSIEAVYRPIYSEEKENNVHSVVSTRAKDDTKSTVSSTRSQKPQPAVSGDVIDKLVSEARGAAQHARAVVNNVRPSPQNPDERKQDGVVGTLLGVAAGAALAYAFTGRKEKNRSASPDSDPEGRRPSFPGRAYSVPTTPSELSRSSSRQRAIELPPRENSKRSKGYHVDRRRRATTAEAPDYSYAKPSSHRSRRKSMSALSSTRGSDRGQHTKTVEPSPSINSRASRPRRSSAASKHDPDVSAKVSHAGTTATQHHSKEPKNDRAYPPSAFDKLSAKVSAAVEQIPLPGFQSTTDNTHSNTHHHHHNHERGTSETSSPTTVKPMRENPSSHNHHHHHHHHRSKPRSRSRSRSHSHSRHHHYHQPPPSRAGTWPDLTTTTQTPTTRSRSKHRDDPPTTVVGVGVPNDEITPDDSISQISSVVPPSPKGGRR